jgi:hypothetical protein
MQHSILNENYYQIISKVTMAGLTDEKECPGAVAGLCVESLGWCSGEGLPAVTEGV